MSTGSSTLPDAMIDLVDHLIDAADMRGFRRRGKSAGGLRDAQADLVLARAALIAALDVPAAWRDVAIERRRHMDAGGTAQRDDTEPLGDFAHTAAMSAMLGFYGMRGQGAGRMPETWPFARIAWRPTDARRDLISAAAGILRELERYDRSAKRAAASPPAPAGPTPLPPQAAAAIAAARAPD